jgi:hypothetical protein
MRCIVRTLFVLLGAGLLATPAQPCSRILWNDNGRSVLVGRNMDWFEDLKSNLWVLPRGMERTGQVPTNPLKWTSKYGSLIVSAYDSVTVDGVNEKGLGVHLLYLPETSTGPRDEKVPGMAMSVWPQHYLDNFGTVAEAMSALKTDPYQLVMVVEPNSGKAGPIHIALNDAAVDSAILFGSIRTVFGWTQYTGREINSRSLANYPMQGNGAEILRLACSMLTEAGVTVCAPVHDAVLIEAGESEIDQAVEHAQAIMTEASRVVLGGFTIGTDAKIVRHPERYMDARGRPMWETIGGIIDRLEGSNATIGEDSQ